ncbi:MAG: DUF3667 domain-containing protein [Eudoraea sp.]|nr:DUF3667 domain-containing protein [Eudoraea sp.]
MEDQSTHTCNNCGAVSNGYFCPECGQRLSVNRVNFKETIQDFADVVFSVNGPLLTTLKGLIKQPGLVIREYLQGKRKKYYKPVAFFLLTTVVYLIIRQLIGFDPFRNSMIQVEEGSLDGTTLTDARNYMLLNINNFLFIFVFTLATFSKLFFFKKYSLAEFLAISFYLIGIYTLFVTCTMFLVQYIGDYLQPIGVVVMFLYFVFAMCSLFQKSYFFVIIKSIVLFILAFFAYFMTAYSLSVLIVFLKQG